jgi:predicted lipid-binding transport protein (Tim44 family)
MGSFGGSIDIILFGMIAAFLVLRLRSILGRRTGYERPPQPPPFQPQAQPQGQPQPMARKAGPLIEGRAEPVPPPAARRTLPEPASPLGQTLARMQQIDHSFTPAGFLDGAEKAFGLIVGAFARGDRTALRPLLSDETWHAFEQAITQREALGQVQVSEIRAIPAVSIESAELRGRTASVAVRIVSDQISLIRDQAGAPVVGTDALTEITDIWTFERELGQSDPTWRLVAARSA